MWISVNINILQVVQNQSVTSFQQLTQSRMTYFCCFDIHSRMFHCFGVQLTKFDISFVQFYLYKPYTILVAIGIRIQNGFYLIVKTGIDALSTCLLAWSMPATFLNALHFSSSQHLWKNSQIFFSHKKFFFWSRVHL